LNQLPDYIEFKPSETGGNGYQFYELEFVQKWVFLDPDGLVFEVRVPEGAEVQKYSRSNYKASGIEMSNGIQIPEFVSKYSREEAFVQENGKYLRYVESQAPGLCLSAVKDKISALQYVIDQTPGICVEAVKERTCNKWRAGTSFGDRGCFEIKKLEKSEVAHGFEYVKVQTPEICTACVKENPYVLKYIDTQTPELCEMAIISDPRTIGLIKNLTYEICKMAVNQSKWAIFHINYKQLLLG
jgi:hypothetical protein